MNWNDKLGSTELVAYIVDNISTSASQSISFRDFMEMCLYHPQYGYYCDSNIKVGKDGDFYTSSAIGSLMGEILAKFIVELFTKDADCGEILSIVEWGGGTGRLAMQLLDEMKTAFPSYYGQMEYTVIEQSIYHREIQKENLIDHKHLVCYMSSTQWFEQGRKAGSIIVSNELLDAFPVHRFRFINDGLHEIYVAWDSEQQVFYEKLCIVENPLIEQYTAENKLNFQEGQICEINLAAPKWIASIGSWMDSGHMITIDYGDISKEIYAEHRMNGTLMCYRKHQAHDDPYSYVGEQDISVHVNFSALIYAGQEAGFSEWTLQTQKDFLVNGGILNKLQDHPSGDPFHPIARKNRAIRQILISDQMSELFKVLVQTKKKIL